VFVQRALTNKFHQLEKLTYGNRFFTEPPRVEGGRPKKVNAFKVWLEWTHRRAHEDLVYDPGAGELSEGNLNVWPGWGCESATGSVELFLELVDHLFSQTEPQAKEWFLDWLAYPLQHPGTKLFSSVVLHGLSQGTGKTFLGEIVGDIYGENFTVLGARELSANFNDSLALKQFALCDEMLAIKDRRKADSVKSMITQQWLVIDRKWQQKYRVRDTINYLFTSNHFDALYLERADRRFLVVQVPDEVLSDSFYKELRAWRSDGGPSYLFDWLLKRDTTRFRPQSRPPATNAHEDMVEAGFSDLDLWVQSLKENPERYLSSSRHSKNKELWEPSEVLELYDPLGSKGTAQKAVSSALIRAGFPSARPRSKKLGGPVRLYAIRRSEFWKSKEASQWASYYDKQVSVKRNSKIM